MNIIDEGKFTDWFKKTFNAYNLGKLSFNSAAKQVLARFDNYRGRVNEDWNEVTWETFYKFLSIPVIFDFQNADIEALVRDKRVEPYLKKVIGTDKWQTYRQTFLQKYEPIGGNDEIGTPEERQKIAQQVTEFLLKLATVQLIDKANAVKKNIAEPTARDGSPEVEIPDTEKTPTAGPLSGASKEQLEIARNAIVQTLKDLGM